MVVGVAITIAGVVSVSIAIITSAMITLTTRMRVNKVQRELTKAADGSVCFAQSQQFDGSQGQHRPVRASQVCGLQQAHRHHADGPALMMQKSIAMFPESHVIHPVDRVRLLRDGQRRHGRFVSAQQL